jgi:hypothetical protein
MMFETTSDVTNNPAIVTKRQERPFTASGA